MNKIVLANIDLVNLRTLERWVKVKSVEYSTFDDTNYYFVKGKNEEDYIIIFEDYGGQTVYGLFKPIKNSLVLEEVAKFRVSELHKIRKYIGFNKGLKNYAYMFRISKSRFMLDNEHDDVGSYEFQEYIGERYLSREKAEEVMSKMDTHGKTYKFQVDGFVLNAE